MTDPFLNLLIIVAIGIIVGLLFNRYAGTWLSRLGRTSKSDITSSLVGIAGAFIGFHVAVALALGAGRLLAYLAAAAGAAAVLWFWRGR